MAHDVMGINPNERRERTKSGQHPYANSRKLDCSGRTPAKDASIGHQGEARDDI
jgi:hypothetical protein